MLSIPRLFAIGDIHGDIEKLNAILARIRPNPKDTIVFLGDYIDRGQYSYEVIERLIGFKDCSAIFLMGNHEKMLLDAINAEDDYDSAVKQNRWMINGGDSTIQSYKNNGFNTIPDSHKDFFLSLKLYAETNDFIFTHGTPKMDESINKCTEMDLLWRRPTKGTMADYKHCSGKTLVCGHTNMKTAFVANSLIIMDTGCGKGGKLSAINLTNPDNYLIISV